MYQTQLFIGGKDRAATNDAVFDCLNPFDNTIATKAAAASKKDAARAANAAAACFPGWSATTAEERRDILLSAAAELEKRIPDFIEVMAMEIGAAESWSRFNCGLAGQVIREAATQTNCLGIVDERVDENGVRSRAIRRPAGVSLGMAAWNAPVILGTRSIAAPLSSGNTVIFKGSELAPQTHRMIVDAFHAGGAPKGAVNFVTNAPEQAGDVIETLIAHPAVRRVNFTGSTRVGRNIAAQCAKHLIPCLLELSGKAPMIVLDDANLDQAVAAAAFGSFFNQGQVCISTERIILDHKIADDFIDRLVAQVATLRAGDTRHADFPLGALINTEAVVRIKGLIDDALSKGAKLLAGGGFEGTVMQPTILDGVDPSMRIYSEESFGPVAVIMRSDGEDEAVSVGNDTEYGLSASVFSQDPDRAMAVAERLETGICHINGATIYDDATMPFGGMKASGYGRFGGAAGIHEFTELRWIAIHERERQYPI